MTTTLKVLSALLGYPTEELKAAAPELAAAIDAEALLPAPARDSVVALIDGQSVSEWASQRVWWL